MRRYDLDWLRVIVFGLLIFYHVGMFFVPWGFHIKNNVIYDGLVWPMRFLNQWRLPLLFVISGMGTYFALSKRTGWQFSSERLKRLSLPLAFGMLVIVPPQVYVERMVTGQFIGSYFDFWPWKAFSGVYPIGNLSWHHLWFLPYLFTFSIILLPCFLYLRKHPDCGVIKWVRRKSADPLNIYLFILPLYLIVVYLEPLFPVTHALIDDWFTFSWYLVFFFYGFILISANDVFWMVSQDHRRLFLINGILGFSLLYLINISFDNSLLVHYAEALIKVFNLWSWILALFGYSAQYLNRSSRFLSYSNEAVYPFYILHQTIMLILGYLLVDLELNFWTKSAIMVMGTFSGSLLFYEFGIRRIIYIRPIFGLKTRNNSSRKSQGKAWILAPQLEKDKILNE